MQQNNQFATWDQLLRNATGAMRQKQFDQALALLQPAFGADSKKLRQWPHYSHALSALAFAYYQLGQFAQALHYQTNLLGLTPNDPEAKANFLLLLKAGVDYLPDTLAFRQVLCSILSQTDVAEYAVAAARALLKDARFTECWQHFLTENQALPIKALGQGQLRVIMQNPLYLLLLRNTLIPLPEFEQLLTKLRKLFLQAYTKPSASSQIRPGAVELLFLGTLTQYLWLTEYAVGYDWEEQELLAGLRQTLVRAESTETLSADYQMQLALLALYQSWFDLPQADNLLALPLPAWKPYLQPLVKDWQAYLTEKALSAHIPQLTSINQATSTQVRQQYEENPFPRWRHDPVAHQQTNASSWLHSFASNLKLAEAFNQPIDVLVAGCGTGLEPISLARQINTNRLLAVDLSCASLAYATSRAEQLALAAAIEFKQADIMELGNFPERFDLITASGVLHHLENPLAGWRILAKLLKPGGIMLASLYSTRARETILRARQLIAEQGWIASPEQMRQLRTQILAGQYQELQALSKWRDFYNLSMFRDLVFHVQEHTYSISLIAEQLAELGLDFITMRGLPAPVMAQFDWLFPDELSAKHLPNWAKFEQLHPNTFAGMYGLVLQKPLANN